MSPRRRPGERGPDRLPRVGHGAYQMQRLDPSKWPVPLRRMFDRRVRELMAEPHLQERDRGAVVQLVRAELVIAALFEHGAQNNMLDPASGELVPSLKVLPGWINAASRLYQVLALTPLADRRVVRRTEDLLSALHGVEDAEVEDVEDHGGDAKQSSGGGA